MVYQQAHIHWQVDLTDLNYPMVSSYGKGQLQCVVFLSQSFIKLASSSDFAYHGKELGCNDTSQY